MLSSMARTNMVYFIFVFLFSGAKNEFLLANDEF